MNTLSSDVITRQGEQTPRRLARICCAPEVSRLKHENITSSQWGEVDPAKLEGLRALADAGNELFGWGTHWIEMRGALPSRRD